MIRFYFNDKLSPVEYIDKYGCKFDPKVGAVVTFKQRKYEVATVSYNLDENRYEVYLDRKK